MKISLQQLSAQTGVPQRSIRYYIQRGLLPRPEGETRAATYGVDHLSALMRIRQWQETGLSLDAIADLLDARHAPPVSTSRPGSLEVRSHLVVADGIELVVAPERASLDATRLRRFFHAVQAAYAEVARGDTPNED